MNRDYTYVGKISSDTYDAKNFIIMYEKFEQKYLNSLPPFVYCEKPEKKRILNKNKEEIEYFIEKAYEIACQENEIRKNINTEEKAETYFTFKEKYEKKEEKFFSHNRFKYGSSSNDQVIPKHLTYNMTQKFKDVYELLIREDEYSANSRYRYSKRLEEWCDEIKNEIFTNDFNEIINEIGVFKCERNKIKEMIQKLYPSRIFFRPDDVLRIVMFYIAKHNPTKCS